MCIITHLYFIENFCGGGYPTDDIEIHLQNNSSVSVSSFRYPGYDPLIKFFECKYTIVAHPGRFIQVEILDAYLDVFFDVLFIGTYSVTSAETDVVISEGNVLEISFRSFEWYSYNRFLLNISEFEYPGENFFFSFIHIFPFKLHENKINYYKAKYVQTNTMRWQRCN